MSRWYRAYEGTCADLKLVDAAITAGCPRGIAIAAWHIILENCCTLNDGGRFDIPARRVAAALEWPIEGTTALINAFEEIGLTQGGTVVAWSRRQYLTSGDTTNAERQRRHKAKKKANQVTDGNGGNGRGNGGNGPVTADNGGNGPQSTDTEEEKTPEPDGSGPPAAPGAPEGPVIVDSLPSLPDTPAKPVKGSIYQECLQRLWDVGVPSLLASGIKEKTARKMIGLWMKDSESDPVRVLKAIEMAREQGIIDPIPWISAGFAKIKEKRKSVDDRKAAYVASIGPRPTGQYGPGDFHVAGHGQGHLVPVGDESRDPAPAAGDG